jgi:hypothetical protein
MATPDRDWLRSAEGRAWLETDEGHDWYSRDPEGIAWVDSAEGREWMDELAQRGFERYFAGEMPEPPECAIMPDDAPRVGDRVRLAAGETTMAGTSLEEGELLIVDEVRLAPLGCVFVSLRTPDGRKLLTGHRGTFVPA